MDGIGLAGKRILLGVSGSIAAYKAPEIVRRLKEQGADVRVVMTQNAERFVSDLTFSAVSGNPVLSDEFRDSGWGAMGHISVTEDVDLVVVAPATANIIGKMASGIADDALSTVLAAVSCPVLIAPAMNDRMYSNRVLQRNIEFLSSVGVRFVEPGSGPLACGTEGQGRLAETDCIVRAAAEMIRSRGALAGVPVLVTAGPTREPIDAVRFISNPSSGRMGYALAETARDRGAEVVLVSGPSSLVPPRGVRMVAVTTAAQMRDAVEEQARHAGIIIMAAAVSDFRPIAPEQRKIKKGSASLTIELEPTDDILRSLGNRKGDRILVGFAAETDDLVRNARKKLEEKYLDLIVANDVSLPGSGFGTATNAAVLIDRAGSVIEVPLMSKEDLAVRILDKVEELKTNQGL
jgi:phosphopantothenoylcysteine decarboxylase/phosphopantothenate--cysteine ligase